MSGINGGARGVVGIGVADYVVFGVSLVIPVIISLYYCCIKKQKSNSEFLMGNRSIHAIPMSFSLCASYMSAVVIMGKYNKRIETYFFFYIYTKCYVKISFKFKIFSL
jgi:sodium-coupled monocarboxylate transporter 8/12